MASIHIYKIKGWLEKNALKILFKLSFFSYPVNTSEFISELTFFFLNVCKSVIHSFYKHVSWNIWRRFEKVLWKVKNQMKNIILSVNWFSETYFVSLQRSGHQDINKCVLFHTTHIHCCNNTIRESPVCSVCLLVQIKLFEWTC